MHISDDLRLGPVVLPADDYWSSGNPAPQDRGIGPLGRVYVWDAVPAVATSNNIVANQSPAAAGALPLNPVPTGGAILKVGADQFSPQIVLDYPRAVTVGAASGGAPFVVYGLDQYGQPMSEAYAAAGTGKKAFKVITRITVGAAGTTINVGTADIVGIPFRLVDKGYIIAASYGGAALPLANFNLADLTSPATQTTGDVRGTVGGAGLDGVKRLVVTFALSAMQVGPNATRLAAAGVTQA